MDILVDPYPPSQLNIFQSLATVRLNSKSWYISKIYTFLEKPRVGVGISRFIASAGGKKWRTYTEKRRGFSKKVSIFKLFYFTDYIQYKKKIISSFL